MPGPIARNPLLCNGLPTHGSSSSSTNGSSICLMADNWCGHTLSDSDDDRSARRSTGTTTAHPSVPSTSVVATGTVDFIGSWESVTPTKMPQSAVSSRDGSPRDKPTPCGRPWKVAADPHGIRPSAEESVCMAGVRTATGRRAALPSRTMGSKSCTRSSTSARRSRSSPELGSVRSSSWFSPIHRSVKMHSVRAGQGNRQAGPNALPYEAPCRSLHDPCRNGRWLR